MKEIFHLLSDEKEYSREDLLEIFRQEKKNLADSTFRWLLYAMQKEQRLFRIDYDTYSIVRPQESPEYKPLYSKESRTVMDMVESRYPDLGFVMFESTLLNEFLNHQIAQNTLYIQVEKDVSSFVFDLLKREYKENVLYKPNRKDFDRYWTRNCIVVLELISQAPLSDTSPHEIVAEKMLVDLIADKSIAATFSPSELPFIFGNVKETYRVDRRKMNRYAGRRGKRDVIARYMGEG